MTSTGVLAPKVVNDPRDRYAVRVTLIVDKREIARYFTVLSLTRKRPQKHLSLPSYNPLTFAQVST